jgi:hypothetical protein
VAHIREEPMHKFSMPEEIIARVVARVGRTHPFEKLEGWGRATGTWHRPCGGGGCGRGLLKLCCTGRGSQLRMFGQFIGLKQTLRLRASRSDFDPKRL